MRADLADLNKKAGITSLPPRHYDRKRGNIRRLDVPPQLEHQQGLHAKYRAPIIESYVPLLSAVDDLAKQNLWRLRANSFSTFTQNIQQLTTRTTVPDTFPSTRIVEQDFVRKAVKTAPMNTASELIKNVQDSPTKQIDPKLKRSVTSLIRSKRAKLLKVECDGVELTSDIGSP